MSTPEGPLPVFQAGNFIRADDLNALAQRMKELARWSSSTAPNRDSPQHPPEGYMIADAFMGVVRAYGNSPGDVRLTGPQYWVDRGILSTVVKSGDPLLVDKDILPGVSAIVLATNLAELQSSVPGVSPGDVGTHHVPVGQDVFVVRLVNRGTQQSPSQVTAPISQYVFYWQPQTPIVTTTSTGSATYAGFIDKGNLNPGDPNNPLSDNLPATIINLSGCGNLPAGSHHFGRIAGNSQGGIVAHIDTWAQQVGYWCTGPSGKIFNVVGEFFYKDDFFLTQTAVANETGAGVTIQWGGFDVIVNSYATAAQYADFVKILNLKSTTSQPVLNTTAHPVKMTLTQDTAVRHSGSCATPVGEANVDMFVDVWNLKVTNCDDSITVNPTYQIRAGNGLTLVGAGAVATITPDIRAGSGITVTGSGGCGTGIVIAATGSSSTFNVKDCGGTVQSGVGTTQYGNGFAVGAVAGGIAPVTLVVNDPIKLDTPCGGLDLKIDTAVLQIVGGNLTTKGYTGTRRVLIPTPSISGSTISFPTEDHVFVNGVLTAVNANAAVTASC